MAEKSELPGRPARIEAAALTDVGCVREGNEDAFALLPEQGLFIVADGMGGHNAGATASKIVVNVLPRIIEQRLPPVSEDRSPDTAHILREAILELSGQVRGQSIEQPGLAGMGATVVLLCRRGDLSYLAHMGDSRAYLFRDGDLEQLTEDHSLIALLLRQKEITPDEARDHPARGRVSRYVGMEGEVYPEVQTPRFLPDDRLLLCTDGLPAVVPDEDIALVLAQAPDAESACRTLVDAANAAGGPDNVTVMVVVWRNDQEQLRAVGTVSLARQPTKEESLPCPER